MPDFQMPRLTFAEALAIANDRSRGMEATAHMWVRDRGFDKTTDPDNKHCSLVIIADLAPDGGGFHDVRD